MKDLEWEIYMKRNQVRNIPVKEEDEHTDFRKQRICRTVGRGDPWAALMDIPPPRTHDTAIEMCP